MHVDELRNTEEFLRVRYVTEKHNSEQILVLSAHTMFL